MADFTIHAAKRAVVLDASTGASVNPFQFAVTSSDPSIAREIDDGSSTVWIAGLTVGTATVTVTRVADGMAVSHTVEVLGAAPFDWLLGPEL